LKKDKNKLCTKDTWNKETNAMARCARKEKANDTEQPEARQKNQTQLKRQPPKALPSGKLT
jgi:hypothetical protein